MATMAVLFYLAASLLVTTVLGDPCSAGWFYNEGSCYGFSDTQVSFAEAARVCQIYNGHLADIENSEENEFVKWIAAEKQAEKTWIGASDIFNEGTFEWLTGKSLNFSFTDWHHGQPTDGNHAEDCVDLNPSYNYTWADDSCTSNYNFICETLASSE